MKSTANYLDPQVLADLHGLALRTRHIVDGFMSGTHRNLDAGTSTEYSQHRPYVPGDDLRHVDWKAFGRTDRLYVKQFMDETNLACTFLLDTSGSMNYQGPQSPLSKRDYASCLTAALAWLVRGQGDAVGISLSDQSETITIPPAATDQRLSEILHLLESNHSNRDADFGETIRDWAMQCEMRQLVVIVGDLFAEEAGLHRALKDLRGFGHEVILFRVCDRDEVEFPFDRFTEFSTLESGDNMTLDAEIYREGYLQQFQAFQSRLQLACRQFEIDFVPLLTDQSLGPALGHFLMARDRPESNICKATNQKQDP